MEQSGAIDAVQNEAKKYSSKCMYLLDNFEDSVYKESLSNIVIGLMKRSN